MPLWGSVDAANNAPKFAVTPSSKVTQAPVYGNTAYDNSTPGAFVAGQVVGVFGVDTTEMGVAGHKAISPGWNEVRMGMGPVVTLSQNVGGSSYGNNALVKVTGGDVNAYGVITTNSTGGITGVAIHNSRSGRFANTGALSFSSPANAVGNVAIVAGGNNYANGELVTISNGTINATGYITTNATGTITGVSFAPNTTAPSLSAGAGFSANTAAVVAIGTVAGTGANVVVNVVKGGASATFAATLGGRAGRVQYEPLVAMKTISSDGSDDSLFPDS